MGRNRRVIALLKNNYIRSVLSDFFIFKLLIFYDNRVEIREQMY